MEKEKFNKIAYNNKFITQAYDRINLTVPKGDKETIKAHAEEFDGGSVNGFIQRAIKETMHRDRLHNSADNDAELREKALALLKQYADACVLPAPPVNFRCADAALQCLDANNEKEGGN